MNKNIVDFCMTQDTFMLMIRGTYYIQTKSDLVLDESKGLERDEIIKAVGSTNTGVAMVMSRASFQSLV